MASGRASGRWRILLRYFLPPAFFALVVFGPNCPPALAVPPPANSITCNRNIGG
jgi:hypothetical protein